MASISKSCVSQVLHRLLEVGISFKADQEGLTALHFAAFAGSEEATSAIIEAKAVVNAQAKRGVTPLMLAARGASKVQGSRRWM